MEDLINWKNPIFSFPKSLGERKWGKEEILESSSGKWTMKKLFIKAGSKGGLQYHRLKDEGGFLISGKLIIRYPDEKNNLIDRVVEAGESFHFPPYCIHQEEAITDCIIIEVSTPHLNDRVRVEEKFGLNISEGLPSTKYEEIIEI